MSVNAGSFDMIYICDNRKNKSTEFCDFRDSNFCGKRKYRDMKNSSDEVRKWIADQLDKLGHGAKTNLATYLGVRPGAITRMINIMPGKEVREIKADELVKMKEFFGSQPPGFESVPGSTSIPMGYVKVTGKVAANTWMSVDDMDFGYDDTEYVPSIGAYPIEWQFGVIVDGNCLNKIANHGDRLVCLDIIKAGEEVHDNDLVVVQRSRYDGQMIERTAKRVRQTTEGYELWPESHDANHQQPIRFDMVEPSEAVQIIGKVLWIVRKP
ncbi:hypothetical protein HBA92_21890 [Ochrobactrum sp. MR28]|nr:hypothetical protein [Ochrobactrum sp. MR28]MBX8818986.1 hypothetical protein [Ochrobactrum sp. MR31]